MALFMDGPISTIDDLSAQDSQLADVASADGIDVTQKLALAQEHVAQELEGLLAGMGRPEQSLWRSARLSLHHVAVTPALKLWHTYRTLEIVYADAYNNQLNDRYAGKRDQFRSMASWAYDKFVRIGAGIVYDPIPRATKPTLTAVEAAAGALPDGIYFVTMAWVNQAGEEGASAEANTISTAAATLAVQPRDPPKSAVAWNVYAGIDAGSMFRQNGAPIPAGLSWTQPSMLTTTGPRAGQGQEPAFFRPMPRVLLRG